jgi:hypothetical protein
MSSLRQIQANRLNARFSTGPVTDKGKKRSRQNAVRHGLTAETVIGMLEDAKDYAAFEMAVTSDYDAQSAVERELVLRLASLLWRLRRATAIETGLFELQVRHLLEFRRGRDDQRKQQHVIDDIHRSVHDVERCGNQSREAGSASAVGSPSPCPSPADAASCSDDITRSFIRLTNLPTCPLDRLSRYEAALWRQACQVLFSLQHLNRRRRPWQRPSLSR